MKDLVLTDDIIARCSKEDHCYKAVFEYDSFKVSVFFMTESQDFILLNSMRSAFLELYENLPSVDRFAEDYMKDSFSEETIDILREYHHEDSLTKEEIIGNVYLGIIRIEEDSTAECDYIFRGSRYTTQFTFKYVSCGNIESLHSCTWENDDYPEF
ncbi:MAG: hypothetical protein ILN61_11055 [Lachnospiraceae bacterium]|nr:hypothetical protein [Lachnospiraceae bacterium]